MKQDYGTERPEETWVETLREAAGAACIVHFNEDIQETTETDAEGVEQKRYTADHHTIETAWRSGLEDAVKANRAAWLAAAVEAEQTGKAKTETEILQEAVAELKASNASLNDAMDELTAAVLEGGI